MRSRVPKIRGSVILSTAVLVVTVACGDDDVTESAPPVASVTVSPDSLAITEGELGYFSAVLRDTDGNLLTDRVVQWSSSDEGVARVSASGLVRGTAAGAATITASSEQVSGDAILTVSAVPVASVSVVPDSLVIVVGETASFQTILLDAEGDTLTGRVVMWSSSDTMVVSIDATGLLTGRGLGSATITAMSEAASGSAEVSVVDATPVAFVATGFTHTCAIDAGGAGYCWGTNSEGQLGDGTREDRAFPVPVVGGLSFESITAGEHHTCGVTSGEVAYCWGSNEYGQLGDSTTADTTVPVPVAGGLLFGSVTAGESHACGIAAGDTAACWGLDQRGQLGIGVAAGVCGDSQLPCSRWPQPVSGGLAFQSISAFSHGHTCGITVVGATYCWGYNNDGQLGTGETEWSAEPVPVSGGLDFVTVDVGFLHTCGLTQDGRVYCWGSSSFGELGDGVTTPHSRLSPTPVSGGLAFESVSAGAYHTCGLTPSGRAYCWGQNEAGQLGSRGAGDSAVPVPVVGGLSFDSISAGWLRTCGITTLGSLYCWGTGISTPALISISP